MNTKEKLRLYTSYKKLSLRQYSLEIGASEGYLRTNRAINSDVLPRIRKVSPYLNINWLFFNENEMIITPSNTTQEVNLQQLNTKIENLTNELNEFKNKVLEILKEK
ncbi:hypothetical protein [Tenacibaculum aiptasiae]|uniref:hypothetical protein n=1 Tax=Tenacibaculum aiptasiae TaxID=426481 RepID=UPI00232FA5E7|nr:hypothetical protein [Tenacibaculum aiptasiae]